MSGFVERLGSHGSAWAIVGDEGLRVSYADLSDRVDAMCELLGTHGRLLVIETENELEPIVAYLAALRSRNPVMLIPPDRPELRASIIENYRPDWIYVKNDQGWTLEAQDGDSHSAMHPDLGVLLSTSGSTGAVKFVRLSHANLNANASSIVEYLAMRPTDCAATTLPFHYCYGLSVINSHLMVGGTLMLTKASVIDDEFWEDCDRHAVTCFAGVPYTFELLDRVGLENKRPRTLRYITQAGGRLSEDRVRHYHEIGQRNGWQLFVMYGQTEATARMAYVPPDRLLSQAGSIGIPIPGGAFHLVDEQGQRIEGAGEPGELVYRGPNVMMGYAEHRVDLADGPTVSELETGDIATRDDEGFYTVVGRSKRFIKLFGLRVSLDEVERKLAAEGFRAVAAGTDEALVIATLDMGTRERIQLDIAEWCRLPPAVVIVREVEDYPLLTSGKVDYAAISAIAIANESSDEPSESSRDIRAILREGTGAEEISADSTFVKLGGDSLSYIRVSLALEALIGYVPERWESLSVADLEALERRRSPWRQIETSILLRAIAIVLIVLNHFHVFEARIFDSLGIRYPGGSAMLLLLVAGFNFGKFQLPRAMAEGAGPILRSAWRVFLPSVAFLLTIQLVSGKFVWSTILMYSNFIGPNVNFGIEPWFIYVLLQILCLMALILAFRPVRSIASGAPYAFSLALLGMTTATALAGPFFWDTEHLLNRTPHIVMFSFILGCCISLGHATWQKSLHSVLLIVYLVLAMSHYTWIVSVGGMILVWAHHLYLVWPLNRVAGAIGSASLFIYLSHHNFRVYAERFFDTDSALVTVPAALVGGIILWLLWEKGMEIAWKLVGRFEPSPSGHRSRS